MSKFVGQIFEKYGVTYVVTNVGFTSQGLEYYDCKPYDKEFYAPKAKEIPLTPPKQESTTYQCPETPPLDMTWIAAVIS